MHVQSKGRSQQQDHHRKIKRMVLSEWKDVLFPVTLCCLFLLLVNENYTAMSPQTQCGT